jgi:hypothetical protein
VLEAAGAHPDADDGVIELEPGGASAFLDRCGALRLWDRELATVSVG